MHHSKILAGIFLGCLGLFPMLVQAQVGSKVDSSKMVSFSLSLDEEDKPQILFEGKAVKSKSISSLDAPEIGTLVINEFEKDESLNGVILRVTKEVPYRDLNQLFGNIQKAMQANRINHNIYVSVLKQNDTGGDVPKTQGPSLPPKKGSGQDDIVTREYVFSKGNANKVYEKTIELAKKLRIEMRIKPERNSLTIKGKDTIVDRFLSILKVNDQSGLSGIPTVPSVRTDGNTTPRIQSNSSKRSTPPSASGNSGRATPENQTPSTGTGLSAKGVPPRMGTTAGNSGSGRLSTGNQGSVGRYQVAVFGSNAVLLDTSTGETWFLNGSEQRPFFWTPIPKPDRNGSR